MIRDQVLATIKAHQDDLKHHHIKTLYIFGSVARGEENSNSDIDMLVSFEDPVTFDRYMDLKLYLEELLKRRVNLVTENTLRPELHKYVVEDLIRAA